MGVNLILELAFKVEETNSTSSDPKSGIKTQGSRTIPFKVHGKVLVHISNFGKNLIPEGPNEAFTLRVA